jgi:SWI/SNF-related matrix-associated actin-dependent regulator 1 of chromatin subfamily A
MSEGQKQGFKDRRCFHGEEAVRRQVQKEGLNKGRFFWTCPRPYRSEQRCAYFAWDEVATTYRKELSKSAVRDQDKAQDFASFPRLGTSYEQELGSMSRASDAAPNSKKQPSLGRDRLSADTRIAGPLGRRLPAEKHSQTPRLEGKLQGDGLRHVTYWQFEIMDLDAAHVWIQKGSQAAFCMLLQLAEDVPGAVLDQSEERVRIPLSSWSALCSAVQRMNGSFRGHPPHQLIQNLLAFRRQMIEREQQLQHEAMLLRTMDALKSFHLWGRLLPFQRVGVERAIRQGGRILLADEMGLGKTIQAIAIAWSLRQDWPVLVICPSSLRDTWRREWMAHIEEEMSTSLDISVIQNRADTGKPLHQVNIVSYELVHKFQESQLSSIGVLILDESHYIKSTDAKRTQFLLPWLKRIPRVLLLTGTPALSRPAELYTQLHGLAPAIFSDWTEFAYRYCGARSTPWKALDTTGATNLAELHRILTTTVMIRRRKSELLDQLPQKIRSVVRIESDASATEPLQGVLTELAMTEQKAATGDQQAATRVKALMSKAFQMTAIAKVQPVLQHCARLWQQGNKFILFAYHELMLEAVETWLKEHQGQWIRIDGKTEMRDRQPLVDRFQSDPQCRVALLALTAAGAGLTLTAAQVVLFAELYWNPGTLRQAEDRVHRIGQRAAVSICYLVLPQSLDERMWRSVQTKLDVLHSSLDGKTGSHLPFAASEKAETLHGQRPLDQFFKRRRQTTDTNVTQEETRISLSSTDSTPNGCNTTASCPGSVQELTVPVPELVNAPATLETWAVPSSLFYLAAPCPTKKPKRRHASGVHARSLAEQV